MLHTHPHLETQLGLDDSHVIVDRADFERAIRPVVLSQRNLLTLLRHVDDQVPLHKPGGPILYAESDKAHYFNRAAGSMSPETETFIKQAELALAVIRSQDGRYPSAWAIKVAKILARVKDGCNPTDGCNQCARIEEISKTVNDVVRKEFGL